MISTMRSFLISSSLSWRAAVICERMVCSRYWVCLNIVSMVLRAYFLTAGETSLSLLVSTVVVWVIKWVMKVGGLRWEWSLKRGWKGKGLSDLARVLELGLLASITHRCIPFSIHDSILRERELKTRASRARPLKELISS